MLTTAQELLYLSSIETIRQNQAPSGAYIACPNFSNYQYCWLRDGSFIAHAMDTAGEYESARAFFCWVDRTLCAHAHKLDPLIERIGRGERPDDGEFLHTRYTLDGKEAMADGWGNFQIDGYGTWLWALAEHVRLAKDAALIEELAESIHITVRFLQATWQLPTFDCWEEHPEYLHPYSLSAVYAGLKAAAEMARGGMSGLTAAEIEACAGEVRAFVLKNGVHAGRLVKHIYPAENGAPCEAVDASLLGAGVPYGMFSMDDPRMAATIEKIEADLHRPGGGVYRFRKDTYYGGGEWILLSAWLGWVYAQSGQEEKAAELLAWIEEQAVEGSLPEQVNKHVLAPEYLPKWKERWGMVARPLIWSHAMYMILYRALRGIPPASKAMTAGESGKGRR